MTAPQRLWREYDMAALMWATKVGDERRRWLDAALTLKELAVALEEEERRG